MKNILQKFVGLLLFSLSLTVLYLSMRAVMGVGGSCAEGGPYTIQVHCPGGVAYLTPLSIFTMIGSGALYFTARVKNSPEWGYLFWTALFGSLGWNFLEFGLNSPGGGGLDVSWFICAVIFGIMGFAPLFAADKNSAAGILFGSRPHDQAIVPFTESRPFLIGFHLLATAAGIYLGMMLFAAT